METERRTVKMNFRIANLLGKSCFQKPADVSWHGAGLS
jgi:hypothetical protein